MINRREVTGDQQSLVFAFAQKYNNAIVRIQCAQPLKSGRFCVIYIQRRMSLVEHIQIADKLSQFFMS